MDCSTSVNGTSCTTIVTGRSRLIAVASEHLAVMVCPDAREMPPLSSSALDKQMQLRMTFRMADTPVGIRVESPDVSKDQQVDRSPQRATVELRPEADL